MRHGWVVVLVERAGHLNSSPPQVFAQPESGQPWPHRVLAEQARRRIHLDAVRHRSSWEAPVHTYVSPIRQEPS